MLNAVPYPSRYLGYVLGWEGAKFPPFLMSAIFLSNAPVLLWHMHSFEKYRSLRRFALVLALGYGFWKDWEILPSGYPRRLARFPVLFDTSHRKGLQSIQKNQESSSRKYEFSSKSPEFSDEVPTRAGAKLGMKLNDTQIDAIVAAADVDGDGQISFEEFDKIARRGHK